MSRMDKYFDIRQRLVYLSSQNCGLCAIIAIGSSVRTCVPGDELSDLDLIIVCENPDDWISGDLPAQLGTVKLSFAEPTFAGGMERRILYDDSLDVDFVVLTPEQIEQAIICGIASVVMGRGYKVLYDNMNITDKLKDFPAQTSYRKMTEQEFLNVVNDFWFHTVWAAKKILRGELWTAKMCVDAYMKKLLLKMLEAARAEQADVWHDGRYLEKWAGEETVTSLEGCFAHYDKIDLTHALHNTAELFSKLSQSVARDYGFSHPYDAEAYAHSLLITYLGEK